MERPDKSQMKLHILREGEELGSLSAAEARELLAVGFLRPSDEFWIDVATEVLPLEKLFASASNRRPPLLARAKSSVVAAGGAARTGAVKISRNVAALVKKQQKIATATATLVLEDYVPNLRNLASDNLVKMLRSAESALADEKFLRKLFGAVYDCLPKPARRFVAEASFVEFCLKHRHHLLS